MSENKNGLITMSEYIPYPPNELLEQAKSLKYVPFGDNNLYPQYLEELFLNSPTHGAVTKSIQQMIYGDGLVVNYGNLDNVVKEVVNDCKLYYGAYIELTTDGLGEMITINTIPFTTIRRQLPIKGVIHSVYYSQDWSKIGQYKPERIPTYNPATFYTDLRQVLIVDIGIIGNRVYPLPDYIGSVKAIDLERQMSELHLSNIENGMFPSFMVNFNSGIPDTPEARQEVINQFTSKLRGSSKAGKALFGFNQSKETETTVQVMEMTNADKLYEQMGNAVVMQIMRGHRVTSPRLFGVLESSGLGNSAEEFDKAMSQFQKYVIIPTREAIQDGLKPLAKLLGIKIEFKVDYNEDGDNTASYTGDQIRSMMEVIAAYKAGSLTRDQALIILETTLGVATDAANLLLPETETTTVAPAPMEAPQALKLQREMTEEESVQMIERLNQVGETIDFDVWELVHEEEAGTAQFEKEYKPTFLSLEGFANPEERSDWGDAGLYKLRYAYSQNLSAGSRSFCQQMVALSVAGVVYRYEDIIAMGDAGENGQFAPSGSSTYNIFDWKGGVYCHHHWKRQIYFRKRAANGTFMPNKGLENDKRVGNVPFVPQKGIEGVAPIDTPSRGSLKNP